MSYVMSDNSVCRECRHCMGEEIEQGLIAYECDEDMANIGLPEGCWRFERREDE